MDSIERQAIIKFEQVRDAWLKKYCFLPMLITTTSACNVAHFDIHRENFRARENFQRPVGMLSFHYSESEKPAEIYVSRIKKGYAIHTPVYQNDAFQTNWVAQKNKEQNWFFGLRGNWKF